MKRDFMIIHGYNLDTEGNIHEILEDRLQYALHLVGIAEHIIVAGKHGKNDEDIVLQTGLTQAAIMKEYLMHFGISPSVIYEEAEGTNTFDCTRNAYERIIKPQNWDSGIIISTHEHLPRVMLQTAKIMPEMDLWYAGPWAPAQMRKSFMAHEHEGIKYTLDAN